MFSEGIYLDLERIMQAQQSLSALTGRDWSVTQKSIKHTDLAKLHLQPEIELIICCSRINIDSQTAERIATLINGEINWDFTIRTSIAHGVMPLLYRSLSAHCADQVPEEISVRLRDYFRLHAQRNLLITGELVRLVRMLESSGIATLPYKGPMLSASAYGDVSLRVFSDLDILVHKKDILRAKEMLLSHGYQLNKHLTEEREAAHLESHDQKDLTLVSRDGLVKVELHWQIASLVLFPLDVESLWSRAEPVKFGGGSVQSLQAEDMLLVLCVHGAKHYFARFEWVCDVAELIRANPALDWEKIAMQAGRLGTRRALYSGLLLANEILDAPLPDYLLKEIYSDTEARGLAADMRASLFRAPDKWSEVFDRGGHRIVLRDKLRDRMRVRLYFYMRYLRIVLTPNIQDKETLRLPGALSFLYYIIRPVRLIKSYGPTLLQHVLGGLMPRRARVSKSKSED